MTVDNGTLSELLARAAEHEAGDKARALRKAARAALTWPEEAAGLLHEGRSLTELRRVGPFVASRLRPLIEDPPAEVLDTPPIRTGFLTVARARAVLAEHPDWRPALNADLQMHTTWSDGSVSVREMADEARAHGYRFIAITDHSKGLKIAGGMDEDTLMRQWEDIAGVNDEMDGSPRLLRALEMNVSVTGDGDMDPAVLAQLDLVLGAFHSKLRVKEDQTDRYLVAMRNPTFDVFAHPRGRIFNFRLGLTADWPRVFAEAVAQDKAVEIDSYPDRQDLNVELLEIARDVGCTISIGTDAHAPYEMAFIEVGLAAAILAGIPREHILNFRPVEDVLAWATARRQRRAA